MITTLKRKKMLVLAMVMTARKKVPSKPTASRGLDAEKRARTKKPQAADGDTQVTTEGMEHAGSVQQQMGCRGNFGRRTAADFFFLVGSRNLVGCLTSSESTAKKSEETGQGPESGCKSGQEASTTPRQARHRSSEHGQQQQQLFGQLSFPFSRASLLACLDACFSLVMPDDKRQQAIISVSAVEQCGCPARHNRISILIFGGRKKWSPRAPSSRRPLSAVCPKQAAAVYAAPSMSTYFPHLDCLITKNIGRSLRFLVCSAMCM